VSTTLVKRPARIAPPYVTTEQLVIAEPPKPQVAPPAAMSASMMIMPVMFTFMFLSYPSGLVIYWTISNLWAIGQQYLTTSLVAPVNIKS